MSNSEASLISSPPHFDGSDYTYWKARMSIFLMSLDPTICDIIEKGWSVPIVQTKRKGKTISTPKDESKWSKEERARYMNNAKALDVIRCALSQEEQNRISTCESAKQAWEKLESIYDHSCTTDSSMPIPSTKRVVSINLRENMSNDETSSSSEEEDNDEDD